MKNLIYITVIFILIFSACGEQSQQDKDKAHADSLAGVDSLLLDQAKGIFSVLPAVAENPENTVTDAKVILGKTLYFDTRLSKEGTESCNTCHNLATYGVDNLPTSPGDNGGFGTRNSPTVFNAALHASQFWDGRAKDVEEQAGMPVTNPVEMAMPNEKLVMKRLSDNEAYKKMFTEAFPDEDHPITFENMRKAIAAFERTLITSDRFDKFLNGDFAALDQNEKHGLKTFMDKGCTACHSGALLGGNLLMKFGIHKDYTDVMDSVLVDEGVYTLTKEDKDKYVFKSQSLRNVEKTYPYFHNGAVEKLDDAVKIMAETELGSTLTEEETGDIVSFLKSLTGTVDEAKTAPPVIP